MTTFSLMVNGAHVSSSVQDRTLLVHLLRDELKLTGTHVGCDTTQCGACTVHLDGMAVKSCTVLAVAAQNSTVKTIEGLTGGDELHPMQISFNEKHALQCGFCTPGMVMAAVSIVERHQGHITEEVVREELEGNMCRCTGYQNIVDAVLHAAEGFRIRGNW
ncbi:MAG: (2Fe-2S)-binding protein [Mesorhizobium sp.]|nr:MAG: (2Fe-2S)-binding protein [Mesorhizobium sp.]